MALTLNKTTRHNRRSTRLKGYDYSQPGSYFVTICTYDQRCVFGQVRDGIMQLNEWGTIAHEYWNAIPENFPNVTVDVYTVMPNHVHAVVTICVPFHGGGETPPLQGEQKRMPTLGTMVAFYKYQTTKLINELQPTPGTPVWQRNFHDRVIRDDIELNKIRHYIINNPIQWMNDRIHNG